MKANKPSSFYFHYNKPASLKFKKPKLSIHFKNKCYIVDFITCNVKINSRNRKSQPRCVMSGKANELIINNNNGDYKGILK